MPTLSETTLKDFARALMLAAGADEEGAGIVAESLVEANLRGHDSHGVMRLSFYIAKIKAGAIQPRNRLKVERETASALVCDGQWGLGQVLARDLTTRLIEKAALTGIAIGTLRDSAHIGRLGEYAEMAAARNMAAILCANTNWAAQRVAPVGGKRPRLGTNPLCIGIPGGESGPFVLDFGTSATAEGKVRVKQIAGEPVPTGWILDPDGNPTTDPNQLYGDPPGTILPMGGDQAYKGFGLAFMIELMCGGLSGGRCTYPNPPPPLGNAATFLIIAPEQMAGFEHLICEVRGAEQYVRSVPRIDGVDRITLPGDPERAALSRRRETGIPLDDGNWNALVKLAAEVNVVPPVL